MDIVKNQLIQGEVFKIYLVKQRNVYYFIFN